MIFIFKTLGNFFKKRIIRPICGFSIMQKMWVLGVLLPWKIFAGENVAPQHDAETQRIYRIMPVGDSITEGGTNFISYRYPLWEKLFSAGYLIQYVGSRTNGSRIGPLAHEGYSGKNTDFLTDAAVKSFHNHPADIVLLHSGHNHSSEENPIPKIISASEVMIQGFRRENPRVVVLLAQVIPSGKSPKSLLSR